MYSSRTTILALLLTLAVLTTASAQVAHVLSPAVVGRTTNAYLPSPAYVAGPPGGTDQLPDFWSAGHQGQTVEKWSQKFHDDTMRTSSAWIKDSMPEGVSKISSPPEPTALTTPL